MERNIRLIVQFDGTDFSGWQQQEGQRTVQGVLRDAIRDLSGLDASLHSSSRTDAGVHAVAMPVCFRLATALPLKAFTLGLNSLLPPDLKVLAAEDVPWNFHARFDALRKTYLYRILNDRVALPLERRTSWHVPLPLDLDAMREAAASIPGRRDFSAFRAAHCDAASPVRTLERLAVDEVGGGIVTIEATADGFLRNMVRIVVGTLVQVGLCRRSPAWVAEVLESRDRRRAGQTAPPQGLFLKEVEYP